MKQFRDTYYYVTEDGKVYSKYANKIKEVKPHILNNYLTIRLRVNKKNKTFYIHRLLCELYKEDWNENLQVNHIDLNKLNNKLDNLEVISCKENIHHYWKSLDKENLDWKPKRYEKEYHNKLRREGYERNKETILEKAKIYRDNNIEKIKEIHKKFYILHREERIEYQKKYRLLKNNS